MDPYGVERSAEPTTADNACLHSRKVRPDQQNVGVVIGARLPAALAVDAPPKHHVGQCSHTSGCSVKAPTILERPRPPACVAALPCLCLALPVRGALIYDQHCPNRRVASKACTERCHTVIAMQVVVDDGSSAGTACTDMPSARSSLAVGSGAHRQRRDACARQPSPRRLRLGEQGDILGPSLVPPIYLSGSFGLVRPAWI